VPRLRGLARRSRQLRGSVGVRATLERSAPFRVDVGFSGEGVEVSAAFGLSFWL